MSNFLGLFLLFSVTVIAGSTVPHTTPQKLKDWSLVRAESNSQIWKKEGAVFIFSTNAILESNKSLNKQKSHDRQKVMAQEVLRQLGASQVRVLSENFELLPGGYVFQYSCRYRDRSGNEFTLSQTSFHRARSVRNWTLIEPGQKFSASMTELLNWINHDGHGWTP